MAKPRIFISSTFYDLRQVRSDLDQFIEALGYEPIRMKKVIFLMVKRKSWKSIVIKR